MLKQYINFKTEDQKIQILSVVKNTLKFGTLEIWSWAYPSVGNLLHACG